MRPLPKTHPQPPLPLPPTPTPTPAPTSISSTTSQPDGHSQRPATSPNQDTLLCCSPPSTCPTPQLQHCPLLRTLQQEHISHPSPPISTTCTSATVCPVWSGSLPPIASLFPPGFSQGSSTLPQHMYISQ